MRDVGRTYAVIEGVAVKVPGVEELHSLALGLGPWATIGNGGEQREDRSGENKERDGSDAVDDGVLTNTDTGNASRHEVEDLAKSNDGKVESREIMVKEKLTLHEEEREVVEGPTENGSTDLIIESLEGGVGVVVTASLPSENSENLEESPDSDSNGGRPPDDRVAKEVNLGVVLAPEVDTSAEDRPGIRARVPSMRLGETGVGSPHDLLQLPELAQEARAAVVDLFDVVAELGVLIVLDVPDRVGKSTATGASDLLLFRSPVGKLDLVGEENTASHDVNKTELGLDGSETLLGESTVGLRLDNLDTEKVVGVTIEAFITIGGNLVLPVGLGDRGSNVVRVKTAVGGWVVKAEDVLVLDEVSVGESVPGMGAINGLTIGTQRLGLVLEKPVVVLILVGVEGDLLLLAASGIHQGVRVEVTTLGVDVTDADSASHDNIGRNILHALVVEGGLELGAHEAVTVAGVLKDLEVNGEHGEVEGAGNHDEAEDASHQVLEPETLRRRVSSCSLGGRDKSRHTMETFLLSPSRTQSWRRVKEPTQAMVKRPTHLMLAVIPRPRPVRASQNHQPNWKAFVGPCSCWLVKQLKANAVKAVAATKGESRRMRRA